MTQFLIFGIVANDWTDRVAAVQPFKLNEQILRLALLHPEIREAILELSPKQAKKRFPERLLRQCNYSLNPSNEANLTTTWAD